MLGPKESYVDILYRKVSEKEAGPNTRLPLRPSSSGECTRSLAYQMHEYLGKAVYDKEEKNPRVKMLLDLGNSVEYHCIKWFREASDEFKSKYKQQTVELFELQSTVDNSLQFIIEGSSDDVYINEGSKCAIDYKSKGDKFHTYRKTDWKAMDEKLSRLAVKFSDNGYWVQDLDKFLKELNDPYFEANFKQLNGYALSEFYVKRGVNHAAIIQYNKNDSSMREIRFKPSLNVFEQVKQKFQTALDAAASNNPNLAPKDFNLGSVKCAFCPYAKQCRPEEDTLKSYFKTLKKTWPKDTNRLGELGNKLEDLFSERLKLEDDMSRLSVVDEEIIALLDNTDIRKIRLDNGEVYELKYLKGPKEHYEVRKSKV